MAAFLFSQEVDPEIIKNIDKDILGDRFELNFSEEEEEDILEPTLAEIEEIEDDLATEVEIFGVDFISTSPTSISATTDLPFPNDYRVSLNDEIRVILTGTKEGIYNLKVGLDGSILFPELGSVQIANKTLGELKEHLSELIRKSYVGVDINISLTSVSAKKIAIIGAVKKPGSYVVNPFTTISNALSYSGGLEDYASLRKIKLKKSNGDSYIFDLYDLLIFGDRSKDITVSAGDTILVESSNKFIEIKGEVIRPKIYEYTSNDKFSDLIDFALGINRNGDKNNITANISLDGISLTKKISKESRIENQDIISLYVGSKVTVKMQDVFVAGKSVTTGFYSSKDEKLTNFLKNIKFSSDIYPFYAFQEIEQANGLVRTSESFSLSDPASYVNMKTNMNSKLYFFNREEVVDSSYEYPVDPDDLITIILPDKSLRIPVKGKITPKQLHLFFGSTSKINEKNVSVITSDNNYIDAYDGLFESDEIIAISFPPDKNENLIEVEISGEVITPGIYSVPSSTSLDDFYMLAGGLRKNAFEPGIILFRAEVKEKQIKAIKEAKAILTDDMIQKSNSISDRGMVDIEAIIKLADLADPSGRVAGEFYEGSETSKNFLLKNGDIIFIPSISSEVVVQGEVLNSSSFVFEESMDYQDYIKAAGGFSDYADKRAVFVIKANGLSVAAGNNIFSGQVEIDPGDTIVVPRNLDQLEALPLISMATKIIADIAFSAASLNAIQD